MKAKPREWLLLAAVVVLSVIAAIFTTEEDRPEYIYLMSGVRGFEDFPMFQSFEEEIRRLGGSPKVLDFEEGGTSSIHQLQLLREEVTENTACILVNGASNANLAEPLMEYQTKGIRILSSQGEIAPEYRSLHVGAVDPKKTGRLLMEKAAELCGGTGSFVIVSETPRGVLTSDIIMNIRYTFEEHSYPNMILSDVLYGYGDGEAVREMFRSFLGDNPDTQVLICISDRMTEVVCEILSELEGEKKPTVLGLGNPDYLQKYIDKGMLKAELLYCDMISYGTMAAQLAVQLVNGECTGREGEIVELLGNDYQIMEDPGLSENDTSGSQVWLFEEYQEWRSEY